ncbi:hypothetical protein CN059_15320 [Sinorhizobium medicae]|nr:hypothetical protein CN059_15320 [Sinorhizobium medicae]
MPSRKTSRKIEVRHRHATFEAVPLDGTGREPNRIEGVAIGAAAAPTPPLQLCSRRAWPPFCDSSAPEKERALPARSTRRYRKESKRRPCRKPLQGKATIKSLLK